MDRRDFLKASSVSLMAMGTDDVAAKIWEPSEGKKERMAVRFLGTGAADWNGPDNRGEQRRLSSILIDKNVLFDFTAGNIEMLPMGIRPEVVFYTHSHDDHYHPESALKADLAQAAAMFYLAPAGKNNLEVSEEKKLYVIYQIRGELTNQPIIVTVFGGDSATDAAWDSKNGGEFWKDVQRSMVSGQWAVLEIDLTEFAYDYISVVKLQAGDSATAGEMYIKEITFEQPEIEMPEPEPEVPVEPEPDPEPEPPVEEVEPRLISMIKESEDDWVYTMYFGYDDSGRIDRIIYEND